MRLGSLLICGLLAGLSYTLLPDPNAPEALELGFGQGHLTLSVGGLQRVDLSAETQGPWSLEAQALETLDGTQGSPLLIPGLPRSLSPPCQVGLNWKAPQGGALILKNLASGAGWHLTLDPSRNVLAVLSRSAESCKLIPLQTQPWHPLTLSRCWGQLLRTLSGLVAFACLSLAILLSVGSRLPKRVKVSTAGSAPHPHTGLWAMGAAFLIASALSLGALQRLPKSFDDVALVFQARIEAQGRLAAPHPPLPRFFGAEGLYENQFGWTGKQALLWPWVLGQALKLRLAWLVNPLVAALCAWLLLRFALAAGLGWEGLLAAWGLALSPFFLELSATYLNMVPALAAALWLAWAAWSFASAKQDDAPWVRTQIGAALITLTALRSYSAFCLWSGISLWFCLTRGRPLWQRFWVALAGYGLMAVVLLLQNHAQTGDAFLSVYQAFDPRDHPGLGPNVGLFWTWGSQGHDLAKVALNLDLYVRLLSERLNGWPGGLAALPLLGGLLLRRHDSLDRLLWCLVLAQVVGYAFYYSADTIHGPRYWCELSGWVLLLQARGVVALNQFLRRELGSTARSFFVALLILGIGASWIQCLSQRIQALRAYNHIEGRLRRAVAKAPLEPSLVFFVSEDPKRYVEAYGLQDPWLQAPYVFARDQGSEEADQALLGYFPGRRVLYWNGQDLSRRRWQGCVEGL